MEFTPGNPGNYTIELVTNYGLKDERTYVREFHFAKEEKMINYCISGSDAVHHRFTGEPIKIIQVNNPNVVTWVWSLIDFWPENCGSGNTFKGMTTPEMEFTPGGAGKYTIQLVTNSGREDRRAYTREFHFTKEDRKEMTLTQAQLEALAQDLVKSGNAAFEVHCNKIKVVDGESIKHSVMPEFRHFMVMDGSITKGYKEGELVFTNNNPDAYGYGSPLSCMELAVNWLINKLSLKKETIYTINNVL